MLDDVRLVFRHFPLDTHRHAFLAARYAEALAVRDGKLIAVGFLRMGPWEQTGMSVAKITRQQFLDDVTDAAGVGTDRWATGASMVDIDGDGDLDIYTMKPDGSDVRKLTDELGYDGGPFFSPDGTRIVYRAHHPTDPRQVEDYRRLLAQGLIRPTTLDVWVMDADGSNKVRLTDNGAANFAPYWHPSGEWIAFSSNMDDPRGRDFELYRIRIDGTGLERLTFSPEFDGFPVFSPDGRHLVFASNRHGSVRGETNIFRAEWVANP